MKITSIMVSLLCRSERDGWLNSSIPLAIVSWLSHGRFDFEFRRAYDHHTSLEARNWTAGEFLESSCDYLLMIDNDTRLDPDGKCFLDLPELALLNQPIVAAAVPVLQHGSLCLNAYMEDPEHPGHYRSPYPDEIQHALEESEGLLQRDAVGFGAVMIRRDVIEALRGSGLAPQDTAKYLPWESVQSVPWEQSGFSPGSRPYSSTVLLLRPDGEGHYPVFIRPRDVYGRTKMGEDIYFCRRAAMHGFASYTSLMHTCGHYHTIDQGQIPAVAVASRRPPTAADYGLEHWKNLPPITEYSITPAIARFLREQLGKLPRPLTVLEFGSGISTLVMADVPGVRVVACEWMEEHRLCAQASVRDDGYSLERLGSWVVEPADFPDAARTHARDRWVESIPVPARFVFIDGPSAVDDPLARLQTLPGVADLLEPGAVIVLDDCQREGERACIRAWQKRYPSELCRVDWVPMGADRVLGVMCWKGDRLDLGTTVEFEIP